MLPGLLQLAKFRKICIFDERALGGWEKGATRVIRKCLISFSSLCQSWWLLRTAQLQGGVLAPRKQAEQQSWAVFSASGKYLFAAEDAICQCTHCASSCLPAEGAASGQYWQLENPSTSGWLSCWDHTWTQKMVNECWHGNALSSASVVPVPCGSPQVFYHALFLDRRAKLIAPLCTSLIVSNLEDAESKHLGDLPVLNLIGNYQLSLLAQSGLSLSPLCALGWHSLEPTLKEAEKLFPRAPCFRGTAAAVFISEGRKDVPCV